MLSAKHKPFMLSNVMLNAIVLSEVVPLQCVYKKCRCPEFCNSLCHYAECQAECK
jgi:hypothetical protein